MKAIFLKRKDPAFKINASSVYYGSDPFSVIRETLPMKSTIPHKKSNKYFLVL